LPELLLELSAPLLELTGMLEMTEPPELTKLLELLGLTELPEELRDEDKDADELVLVDIGRELGFELVPVLGKLEDELKNDVLEIPDEEKVCDPADRVVSDEDDAETVQDVEDDMEEGINEELVTANVLDDVEELEIVPNVIGGYVEDDDITELDVVDRTELKLEELLLAELEKLLVAVLLAELGTLLVEGLALLLRAELEEVFDTTVDEPLVAKLEELD
jgi:hypothetical protein